MQISSQIGLGLRPRYSVLDLWWTGWCWIFFLYDHFIISEIKTAVDLMTAKLWGEGGRLLVTYVSTLSLLKKFWVTVQRASYYSGLPRVSKRYNNLKLHKPRSSKEFNLLNAVHYLCVQTHLLKMCADVHLGDSTALCVCVCVCVCVCGGREITAN